MEKLFRKNLKSFLITDIACLNIDYMLLEYIISNNCELIDSIKK